MTKMHATAATLAALATKDKEPPKEPPPVVTPPAPPVVVPPPVPEPEAIPTAAPVPSVPEVVPVAPPVTTPAARVEPLPRIRVRFTCRDIPRGAGIGWYIGKRRGWSCPLPPRFRQRVVVRVPAVTE